MTATLCLIACLLTPSEAPDRPAPGRGGEWVVGPRLSKAQELVYRGTFTEEADGGGVQFNRAFRIESRFFVLDTPSQGAALAILTVLKSRDPQANTAPAAAEAPAASVRLELVHVDAKGAVTADPGVSLVAPLDAPPSLECGAFVAVPDGKIGLDATWESGEEGRPSRDWRAAGADRIDGVRCLRLEGVQKSEEWDHPRADRAAWRRTDTVWISPRLGVACRVERVIERREPAHRDPTYKSVLRYDLEEPMQYFGRLYDERQREIAQARAFADAAAPLLVTPAKNGPQLAALMNRIAYHIDHQPQTPYREAIYQVKRLVEAGQRGETPPAPAVVEKPDAPPPTAAVGAAAPDFLAPDLVHSGTFRLRQTLGKPVLLVFFNPASPSTADVLGYAQQISDSHGEDVTVLALSASGDLDAARKRGADLKLTVPLLDGNGLRTSYTVDGTPKLMLLDAAGVLRAEFSGWGRETPDEVMTELRRWVKK